MATGGVAAARWYRAADVMVLLGTLAGCGTPTIMHVRAGSDPKYADDSVRFRTTYYFRVVDYCDYDAPGTLKSGEKKPIRIDSLYRYTMTGKAGGIFSRTFFEAGTLKDHEISPFGRTVRRAADGSIEFVDFKTPNSRPADKPHSAPAVGTSGTIGLTEAEAKAKMAAEAIATAKASATDTAATAAKAAAELAGTVQARQVADAEVVRSMEARLAAERNVTGADTARKHAEEEASKAAAASNQARLAAEAALKPGPDGKVDETALNARRQEAEAKAATARELQDKATSAKRDHEAALGLLNTARESALAAEAAAKARTEEFAKARAAAAEARKASDGANEEITARVRAKEIADAALEQVKKSLPAAEARVKAAVEASIAAATIAAAKMAERAGKDEAVATAIKARDSAEYDAAEKAKAAATPGAIEAAKQAAVAARNEAGIKAGEAAARIAERAAAHAAADEATKTAAKAARDAAAAANAVAVLREGGAAALIPLPIIETTAPRAECGGVRNQRRGFQIHGPAGWEDFNQDERLLLVMSSDSKPLIGALKAASDRIIAYKTRKSTADPLPLLVLEGKLAREAAAIIDLKKDDVDQAVTESIKSAIDKLKQDRKDSK